MDLMVRGCIDGAQQYVTHFSETYFRPLKRWPSAIASLSFFLFLFLVSFVYWTDISFKTTGGLNSQEISTKSSTYGIPLNCSNKDILRKCPVSNDVVAPKVQRLSNTSCPEYFRWIHEDLRPWKSTGITRDMIESGRGHANFRLVIVNGKAYIEKYSQPFQTRDTFTIWGILQLLRLYPGKVPDLELMFWCNDSPVILKRDYQGPNAALPPPVFHYCSREEALDIVFPDWTFWGWAEINIRPWKSILEDILRGNKKVKWKKRVPYAYWKGNPNVASSRGDLMKCNVSDKYDWNARLYNQDWGQEIKEGFKNSKLEKQCAHRYKIYIEGRAWSVSEKYILACDAMTLLIKPQFYDFFTRSMLPMKHFWPIRSTHKCRDIKFAVDWGNTHKKQAEAIGKAGSRYVEENLKMEYVYDYMLHVLIEYAKLLKFKPEIPSGAKEICPETMVCGEDGFIKKFMMESMVTSPSDTLPCTVPPPFDPPDLQAFRQRKDDLSKQVEIWENKYWENINKKS